MVQHLLLAQTTQTQQYILHRCQRHLGNEHTTWNYTHIPSDTAMAYWCCTMSPMTAKADCHTIPTIFTSLLLSNSNATVHAAAMMCVERPEQPMRTSFSLWCQYKKARKHSGGTTSGFMEWLGKRLMCGNIGICNCIMPCQIRNRKTHEVTDATRNHNHQQQHITYNCQH